MGRKVTLSPMVTQYVVGLCCLRHDPEAVEVMIGDMVADPAAGIERDVDVTVRMTEADGSIRAFKGYEVKREGPPLDVVTVEQLCMKFSDMPGVTHRSIVSTSGYTDSARRKAEAHGVQLFHMKPWETPIRDGFAAFDNIGTPQEFVRSFVSTLLWWQDTSVWLGVPGATDFLIENAADLYSAKGTVHSTFPTFGDLHNGLVRRSAEILWRLKPCQDLARSPFTPVEGSDTRAITASLPYTHTLPLKEDEVYLSLDGSLKQAESASISGSLYWSREQKQPQFYVLEQVPTGDAFAGAAIAEWGSQDGKMFAMVFSPSSREVGIHTFALSEKQKNSLRRLRLPMMGS